MLLPPLLLPQPVPEPVPEPFMSFNSAAVTLQVVASLLPAVYAAFPDVAHEPQAHPTLPEVLLLAAAAAVGGTTRV